jgi:hypothetical protein
VVVNASFFLISVIPVGSMSDIAINYMRSLNYII